MKKWLFCFMLIIITIILFMSCSKSINVEQVSNSMDINNITDIDGCKISQSQDGEKEIYCTKDRKLILVFDNNQKAIYENYRNITENPYSILDFDEYKIQWSKDSNYVYVIDSIYDFKNDKLVPIKDCIIFSWIDNKGVYLADGTYYEISYDGGLQNQMAVGKKIKIIENGVIEEKSKQIDDRHFILDDFINVGKSFEIIGDYIIINTASLKYKEEQLQEKIKEDIYSNKFREFLIRNYDDDLNKKYREVINVIKESKEFQELQYQINDLEKKYPIEFEGDIKEITKMINDTTYFNYNVTGKYYLKDIKEEEVKFR